MTDRIVSGRPTPEDAEVEVGLRPRTLSEYIGQREAKAQLEVFIRAASERGEALDHVLLSGPPGLGKTTLAHIIARELGANLRLTSGPSIERPADLASILTNLEAGDVLFIDEVHRLPRPAEEVLYPAMEDGVLDIVTGKGLGAQTLRLTVGPFTVIGATTRAGLLSAPLRDRFGISLRLDFYAPEDLEAVVRRTAKILDLPIEPEAVRLLAERGRGTPRVVNRLLKRLRDYAQVRAGGVVTEAVASEGLRLLGVDERGLDPLDRRYVTVLAEQFHGGPVGVETLAAALAEDVGTLEEVVEPYLIQLGVIARTPRGRQFTAGGRPEGLFQ